MRFIVPLVLCAASVHANSLCLEGGFLGSLGKKVCTFANEKLTKAEEKSLDLVKNVVSTAKTDFNIVSEHVQDGVSAAGDAASNLIEGTSSNDASSNNNNNNGGSNNGGSDTKPENAADTVSQLLDFVTTVNPISIGTQYYKTVQDKGFGAANAELKTGPGQRLEQVLIGFAKGGAEYAISFLPFSEWLDLAMCLVGQGVEQAIDNWLHKRDILGTLSNVAHVTATGLDVVKSCQSKKFNDTSSIFELSSADQRLGATFAKVASLMTPVGQEAAAAAVGKKLFSLAFPGNSKVGKVLKYALPIANKIPGVTIPSSLTSRQEGGGDDAEKPVAGEGFTYQESLAVKDALINKPDFITKCVVGYDPTGTETNAASARLARRGAVARRQAAQNNQRANAALLCPVPEGAAQLPTAVGIDVNMDDPSSPDDLVIAKGQTATGAPADSDLPDAVTVYDTDYTELGSANLVDPPSKIVARKDSTAKQEILADFQERNSSSLSWSSDMTDAMISDDLWSLLRKAFEATYGEEMDTGTGNSNEIPAFREKRDGALDTFTSALGIYSSLSSPGQLALTAGSASGFMKSDVGDANLKRLQKFTGAVIEQVKKAATDITDLKADADALKDPKVSFYYNKVAPAQMLESDKGLRSMSSTLSFIAEDVPGLAFALPKDKSKIYRPLAEAALWHVFPGIAASASAVNFAAKHVTFSNEIAQKGRVSMVVHI